MPAFVSQNFVALPSAHFSLLLLCPLLIYSLPTFSFPFILYLFY